MSETLRIFVSATRDLEAERAVIGRVLADLPVAIRAEIRRSQVGMSYDTLFEQIGNVDRVYFLMGGDITAPAGQEWHLAWQLERPVLALRRPGGLTPAGQEFVRAAIGVAWTPFRTGMELGRLVTQDLVRLLLHPANRYGLNLTEVEALNRYHAQVSPSAPGPRPDPGGAEGGGILLEKMPRLDDDP